MLRQGLMFSLLAWSLPRLFLASKKMEVMVPFLRGGELFSVYERLLYWID